MNSVYIHIPFCRKACRYCDFFFTVSPRYHEPFVDALIDEIRQRASDSGDTILGSLYLGGGTPSQLSPGDLERILEEVNRHFSLTPDAEVTMECNPDDLVPGRAEQLKNLGFNRLSIGIQSFHDRDLVLLNRSHDASQAARSVELAAGAGFRNITSDLIYGIPGQSTREWEENLERILELPLQHVSAYHLSFEAGTVFDHWRKKGKIIPVSERHSMTLYRILREKMAAAGFEHYEISNFARKSWRSRHNSRYWTGEPYLGFGPSAHSFDGTVRSWNVSSLKKYMEGVRKRTNIKEMERLTGADMYHDYLITSLRTIEGADRSLVRKRFGDVTANHFHGKSARFIREGIMLERGNRIAIDPRHWLISDHVVRELFLADEGGMTDG